MLLNFEGYYSEAFKKELAHVHKGDTEPCRELFRQRNIGDSMVIAENKYNDILKAVFNNSNSISQKRVQPGII